MAYLPSHGQVTCNECFSCGVEWGKTTHEEDGYLLENNPGSWGSINPRVLILGFSKGYNQTNNILTRNFNDIPFSGWRDRLDSALKAISVLAFQDSVEQKINKEETDFAFGSVIKCSIAKYNNSKGQYEKTGNNILSSTLRNKFGGRVVRNCVKKFLIDLPDRLKLVIFLGNDRNYMPRLYEILKEFYPDLQIINEVAYKTKSVTFVHITHPARGNGHFKSWLSGTTGDQPRKRELANSAVLQSGYRLNPQD